MHSGFRSPLRSSGPGGKLLATTLSFLAGSARQKEMTGRPFTPVAGPRSEMEVKYEDGLDDLEVVRVARTVV